MKIIHTGDWHIGKILNDFSMLDEQKYILDQMIDIIDQEKPDALIIAGDIFDRSIPPVEAVELVNDVFNRILLKLTVPIIAVSGNHDSAERLSFGSSILTKNGLHIAGTFNGSIKSISLEDEYGPVNFYMLPYVDPRNVRHLLKDSSISTHDDAMRVMLYGLGQALNKKRRNIMVTHGYITYMAEQAEYTCESERPLSIGGTDIVNSSYFNIFNYTALGHLHAPQKAGAENIRYSGSIMKYSFSEVTQKKGVTLVELDREGVSKASFYQLKPRKDMRIIKGPLMELMNPAVYQGTNTEDYVYAVLTDNGELIDPISKLRTVYPNIMGLSRERNISAESSKTAAGEGYKSKSVMELFNEFYTDIQGESLGQAGASVIDRIIRETETEGL